MQTRQILSIAAGVLTLFTGIYAVRFFWFSQEPQPVDTPAEVHELSGQDKRLSGPFRYKNLTVYLVHGKDTLTGRTPLTLEEAIERKAVIVHETADVNELAIENVSAKDEVFVQAGDIVKGGQQDRVLAVDLIVPARSGRMPIDSFCVEQGRWTSRGSESRAEFNSSADYAPSKELTVAAKHGKSQQEVWNQVEESQEKLSAATNSNTASAVSRSSLPLTLENQNVRRDSGEYVKTLSDAVDGKADVIGFVFAINGRINSAETYGSSALFAKLWPKLLKAASIEAVAESRGESADLKPVAVADIESFFKTAEAPSTTETRPVTDRVTMTTRESKTTILFESTDDKALLHRNYIFK